MVSFAKILESITQHDRSYAARPKKEGCSLDSSIIALLIIGGMMVLYVTELIPLATTSLLGCLALAVFGVIPYGDAFKGFSNDIVYLIVGMVIVGDALFETGAAALIGKKIVAVVGTNERAFLAASIAVIIPISAFLSNTATVAMMLPITASAVGASKGKLKKKDTYMLIGMMSIVSGGLTLVGSTPQLIAQGLLLEGGYEPIGFFELSFIGVPVFLLLVAYILTFGHTLKKKIFNFPEVEDDATVNQSANDDSQKKTRRDVVRMCTASAILIFCIVGFISGLWTMGVVAMVGAVLCIITGCISQQKVFQKMSWTTVIIMGCSFGLASGLEQSGAGRLVAQGMISVFGESITPWLFCSALALVAVLITNLMSSTATAALLVPIAAIAAFEMDYSVRAAVMAVAIASNLGFATPIATPPLTMTLAGGYRFKDYVKFGGIFNIMAYIMIVVLFPLVLNI